MSSLVRRMQLANKRRKHHRRGVGKDAAFGAQVGVKGRGRKVYRKARGSRRGKRNAAYIARRKALAA